MHTRLVAVAVAVAVVAAATVMAIGGLVVVAIGPLGVAGAQEVPAEQPAAGRHGPLGQALDALVADSTLTEAQATSVAEAVRREVAEGRQDRKDRRAATLAVVADALGSSPDEVKTGLGGATSIAAQAETAGVERQVVDDALTVALTDRIDAAVEAGKLTEGQAARSRQKLDAVVDRILDADGSGADRGGSRRPGDRTQDRQGD